MRIVFLPLLVAILTLFLACGEADKGVLFVDIITISTTPPSAVKIVIDKDTLYEGSVPVPGITLPQGGYVLEIVFLRNNSWITAPPRIVEIESGRITYVFLLLE